MKWNSPIEKPTEWNVLLLVEKWDKSRTVVKGCWIRERAEELQFDDNDDICDYDEENDIYWFKEGWYEWPDYTQDEYRWFISDTVIGWLPIDALTGLEVD